MELNQEEHLWQKANRHLRRKVKFNMFFRDVKDRLTFKYKVPKVKPGYEVKYLGPVFCQNCGKRVKNDKPSQLENMIVCGPCMQKLVNKKINGPRKKAAAS